MNRIFDSMKKINFRLLLALLLLGLIPTVYTTVRIFLIGQLPGDWGFNIASQLSWVNLLYEILQEALILPLFYFIGMAIKNRLDLENKIRTGIIFTGAIYSILSMLIVVFAVPLINIMAQDTALINETATYIRLETVAAIFMTLVKFSLVTLVVINKDKYIYYLLGLQMILTVLVDVFFVSSLSFSLNLGVNGIAFSNIIVNLFLMVLVYFILRKEDINVFSKQKLNFGWIKDLFKIGGISGLESFVRNIAFMFMVIRMVNVVGEQGTFWVANNFIWGWLLLPVLQLGELVKRDCGESDSAIKDKTLGYFGITTIIVILWAISIPLWKPFLRDVLQLNNYTDVFNIALVSIGFYVLFAYNNVIDSIFYGIGKTKYMLFQSVIINSVFYGTLFVLYVTGVYQPTLMLIAIMFAAGIAFDSLLTYGMFIWMLRSKNIKLI
ncbi:MATE family Na+-driven efflux transporter [Acholeplasma equifetale]|uniref:MATE family Na+-driven efflux transporter n=1 Tax=Acholeplasma equifetale TaxID=264634 RepID=UPI00047A919C|nr:MATE family Na+-driven efflux transporter [Acholeplasma equifetale]